jgi:hypothetical protein
MVNATSNVLENRFEVKFLDEYDLLNEGRMTEIDSSKKSKGDTTADLLNDKKFGIPNEKYLDKAKMQIGMIIRVKLDGQSEKCLKADISGSYKGEFYAQPSIGDGQNVSEAAVKDDISIGSYKGEFYAYPPIGDGENVSKAALLPLSFSASMGCSYDDDVISEVGIHNNASTDSLDVGTNSEHIDKYRLNLPKSSVSSKRRRSSFTMDIKASSSSESENKSNGLLQVDSHLPQMAITEIIKDSLEGMKLSSNETCHPPKDRRSSIKSVGSIDFTMDYDISIEEDDGKTNPLYSSNTDLSQKSRTSNSQIIDDQSIPQRRSLRNDMSEFTNERPHSNSSEQVVKDTFDHHRKYVPDDCSDGVEKIDQLDEDNEIGFGSEVPIQE